MRALAMLMCGLLAFNAAQADENAADTVALINARLAADPFYVTDGYAIALPSACIVEIIPRGSRLRAQNKQRLALHVLDRSAVEHLRFGGGETWLNLVGRAEGTAVRKGFPATPDMNEKGFPKDGDALLSYGILLRFGQRDSARDVAQAFVYLATLCLDEY